MIYIGKSKEIIWGIMSYQGNIPLATDLISVSQNDILNNFTSIQTAFDVNHIDFNASGAGKHKYIQLPNINNVPGAANQGGLFAFAEDIWARKGNGTSYQLTNGASGNVDTTSANGSSFLPGGLIIKWGRATILNGTKTISVSYTTPMTSGTFSAVATSNTDIANSFYTFGINNRSANGFDVNITTAAVGNVTFFWMAIGL